LRADAVVDENLPRAVFDEQAPHREGNAVALVGGEALLPQRARHHAEHGASVEGDGAVAHLMQLEAAHLHRHARASWHSKLTPCGTSCCSSPKKSAPRTTRRRSRP